MAYIEAAQTCHDRTGVYGPFRQNGLTFDHQENCPFALLGFHGLAKRGVDAPVGPRVLHDQVGDGNGQVGERPINQHPIFHLSGRDIAGPVGVCCKNGILVETSLEIQ